MLINSSIVCGIGHTRSIGGIVTVGECHRPNIDMHVLERVPGGSVRIKDEEVESVTGIDVICLSRPSLAQRRTRTVWRENCAIATTEIDAKWSKAEGLSRSQIKVYERDLPSSGGR